MAETFYACGPCTCGFELGMRIQHTPDCEFVRGMDEIGVDTEWLMHIDGDHTYGSDLP